MRHASSPTDWAAARCSTCGIAIGRHLALLTLSGDVCREMECRPGERRGVLRGGMWKGGSSSPAPVHGSQSDPASRRVDVDPAKLHDALEDTRVLAAVARAFCNRGGAPFELTRLLAPGTHMGKASYVALCLTLEDRMDNLRLAAVPTGRSAAPAADPSSMRPLGADVNVGVSVAPGPGGDASIADGPTARDDPDLALVAASTPVTSKGPAAPAGVEGVAATTVPEDRDTGRSSKASSFDASKAKSTLLDAAAAESRAPVDSRSGSALSKGKDAMTKLYECDRCRHRHFRHHCRRR